MIATELLYERSFARHYIVPFDHGRDPDVFTFVIAPFVNADHMSMDPHKDFGAGRDVRRHRGREICFRAEGEISLCYEIHTACRDVSSVPAERAGVLVGGQATSHRK